MCGEDKGPNGGAPVGVLHGADFVVMVLWCMSSSLSLGSIDMVCLPLGGVV